MSNIHPTAIIEKGAEISSSAKIGAYCTVSAKAKIHNNVELLSHVTILGDTEIGEGTIIYPFASLGAPGQIYRNTAEIGRLEIGARCEIREHVTMNCGSPRDNMITKVGNDCMFMVASHIAHDCLVGNEVIFANNATLGGHVKVGDQVFLGGLSAVHQFCEIGEQAVIGGVSGVRGHVIPYGRVNGDEATLDGLNLIGLQRRGATKDDIASLNRAFKYIFLGEGVFQERVEHAVEKFGSSKATQRVIEFIKNCSDKRPLTLAHG